MAEFHSIRLHGPWQATVLECYQSEPADFELNFEQTKRLKIPCDWGDWLGPDFRGRVQFVRKFNLPTNLEPSQSVWLVVESLYQNGSFDLNGQPIGTWQNGDAPFRADVRQWLRPANALTIVVDSPGESASKTPQKGGLIGSVRLEIETV